MSERSEQIEQKINQYKRQKLSNGHAKPIGNLAMNIAIELLSAAITGLIVGLILDHLFATKIFMVICMILSFISGGFVIYKKYIQKTK